MTEETSAETKTLRVDKIGSATTHLHLSQELEIRGDIPPRVGNVAVVRTLTDNPHYHHLELPSGRPARIKIGDHLAGVFGRRRALKGFVGDVPEKARAGDKMHLLNMGGLIGKYAGRFHGLGRPIQVEYLGTAVHHGDPLNIAQGALEPISQLKDGAPMVFVLGTSMQVGKTQAVCELIQMFSRAGYRAAGAKLSGVAALRDTLNMEDHGAFQTLSFLACGHPSTVGVSDIGPIARTLIHHLNAEKPDVIVVEMGDGILGEYEVNSLFAHRDIMFQRNAFVLCASDFVGAWGGVQLLRRNAVQTDVISGPVTDSKMGVRYLKQLLDIPAANAINDGKKLFELVESRLKQYGETLR